MKSSKTIGIELIIFKIYLFLLSGEGDWEFWNQEDEESRPEFVKVDEGAEVINENDKLLIFATGLKGYTPHQVRQIPNRIIKNVFYDFFII